VYKDLCQMRNGCNFITIIPLFYLLNINLNIRLNLIKVYRIQNTLVLNLIKMLIGNIKHFNCLIN